MVNEELKKRKIEQIFQRYSIRIPNNIELSCLEYILHSKMTRAEVQNISEGRKSWDFTSKVISSLSNYNIRDYIENITHIHLEDIYTREQLEDMIKFKIQKDHYTKDQLLNLILEKGSSFKLILGPFSYVIGSNRDRSLKLKAEKWLYKLQDTLNQYKYKCKY